MHQLAAILLLKLFNRRPSTRKRLPMLLRQLERSRLLITCRHSILTHLSGARRALPLYTMPWFLLRDDFF